LQTKEAQKKRIRENWCLAEHVLPCTFRIIAYFHPTQGDITQTIIITIIIIIIRKNKKYETIHDDDEMIMSFGSIYHRYKY